MQQNISPIRVWSDVNLEQFEQRIWPLQQPAVLKGLVDNWPLVDSVKQDANSVSPFLSKMDSGEPVYTVVGQPEINGRFFYREDLQGVNFQRSQTTISSALQHLATLAQQKQPHALAVQAASVKQALPEFVIQHTLPILDPSVEPTLWMGNQAIVAPHYDISDNIACVVAGKRTFTLFPPEQISNLYIGPTLDAPGGVPISLVDLREPDLDRFPRFSQALEAAQQATLEPGDAIFIPSPWWHAVESHHDINVLINYWWSANSDAEEHANGKDAPLLSPNQSLMHSMLSVAKLEESKRQSWRHFFDYLVFKNQGDPAEHLPEDLKDVVTSLSPEQKKRVFDYLKNNLD